MTEEKKNYIPALIVLTSLFFMWGFITCMNDIVIPYLKGVFNLNYANAMLVQLAFFGAYFIGSIIYFIISATTGDPINKIGYKNGIIIGLLTSATGTALFYVAAEFVSYPFFLSALFILGLGLTMLQIAANPYVAILGNEKTASSRLNLAQGFNSLGTTLAPIIGGFLIFKYFIGPEISGADSVKVPYLIFSVAFLVLAIVIKFSKLPVFNNNTVVEKGVGALKYRHLILGMVAIFMYVGAEVSIGSFLINYLKLDFIASLNEAEASKYVAFYWGGLMIGRFLGAISLSKLKQSIKTFVMIGIPILSFAIIYSIKGIEIASIYGVLLIVSLLGFFIGKSQPAKTLYIFSFIIVILLITSVYSTGTIAIWSILGIGLFNSIMWSNIFTLAISKLGKYTSQASSLLVMMIVGGAIFPLIQGQLADMESIGVQNSFLLPVISYLYLAYYGIRGHRVIKA